MQYLLLIHEPRGQRAPRSREEGEALYARMLAYGDRLQAEGHLVVSASLESDDAATSLSRHGGSLQRLDGPFAEAKEMVGGFFLIEADSREQALTLAAECPAVAWTRVEVRAVAPCYR